MIEGRIFFKSNLQTGKEKFDWVDAILLESGNPNLNIKVLSGTGSVHNLQLSRQIREQIKVPVFHEGGLNSCNVREAIETVQPFGLDICSGARSLGKLNNNKLEALFEIVNKVNI